MKIFRVLGLEVEGNKKTPHTHNLWPLKTKLKPWIRWSFRCGVVGFEAIGSFHLFQVPRIVGVGHWEQCGARVVILYRYGSYVCSLVWGVLNLT